MGSKNEAYRISALWDDTKVKRGWYSAIHKANFRWKLTKHHTTRQKAILQALDMIKEEELRE